MADRLEICCSIQLSYGTIGCKSNISGVGFQIGGYLCLCKKPYSMKSPLRLEPVIDTVYKLVPERPCRRLPEDADENTLLETLTANAAHFAARELLADRLTAQGKIGEACQLRLDGCQLLADLMDATDDDLITLDWEDPFTAQALSMAYDSAADHFMIGDFEMAAAMLEMLADRDPEDHLNAAELLAFCYAALEEWELFDETAAMLPEDALSTQLAGYWAAFRRGETTPAEIRETMKRDVPALYKEWTATEHEITPAYFSDVESRRPTASAEARRLWLRTEPLWRAFPEFTESLKA